MMGIVPFELIDDNPWQSRLSYDEESLVELAEDIRSLREQHPETLGLIQVPLGRIVVDLGQGETEVINLAEKYLEAKTLHQILIELGGRVQLAAGHRRKRALLWLRDEEGAARWPGLPVQVAALDNRSMARVVRSENFKRTRPSVIEDALAMKRALEDARLGYGSLAELANDWEVAKSTASNRMRLLELPEEVRADINAGKLAERTARELLPLVQLVDRPDGVKNIAREAIDRGLTAERVQIEVNNYLHHVALLRRISPAVGKWSNWGEKLPRDCEVLCTDCAQRVVHRKQAMCKDQGAYEKRLNAFYKRVEIAAGDAVQRPVSRKLLLDEGAVQQARRYNGGCLHLCVGYKQYAWNGVAVDGEKFPDVYYTCEMGNDCTCSKDARVQRAENDNPRAAELEAWKAQQKLLVAEEYSKLDWDLRRIFEPMVQKLVGKELTALSALLKQCGIKAAKRDPDMDRMIVTLVETSIDGRHGRIRRELQGQAMVDAAEIRQMFRIGTPVNEAWGLVQLLRDRAKQAELEGWPRKELAKDGWKAHVYLDDEAKRAGAILRAHPGHEDLKREYIEALQALGKLGYWYTPGTPAFSAENGEVELMEENDG